MLEPEFKAFYDKFYEYMEQTEGLRFAGSNIVHPDPNIQKIFEKMKLIQANLAANKTISARDLRMLFKHIQAKMTTHEIFGAQLRTLREEAKKKGIFYFNPFSRSHQDEAFTAELLFGEVVAGIRNAERSDDFMSFDSEIMRHDILSPNRQQAEFFYQHKDNTDLIRELGEYIKTHPTYLKDLALASEALTTNFLEPPLGNLLSNENLAIIIVATAEKMLIESNRDTDRYKAKLNVMLNKIGSSIEILTQDPASRLILSQVFKVEPHRPTAVTSIFSSQPQPSSKLIGKRQPEARVKA